MVQARPTANQVTQHLAQPDIFSVVSTIVD